MTRCRVRAEAAIWVPVAGVLMLAAVVAPGSVVGPQDPATAGRTLSVSQPRVVLVKSRRLLHLFDGETLIRSYPIDLGIAPAGPKRRAGDGRTPEGLFHVGTKNAESPYHRFIGIDYPGIAAAEWGQAKGLISQGEAAGIGAAIREGRCPDWGTALGGGIGIHGDRRGRDWTGGCAALANADIEELFSVLRIGDPVEILP